MNNGVFDIGAVKHSLINSNDGILHFLFNSSDGTDEFGDKGGVRRLIFWVDGTCRSSSGGESDATRENNSGGGVLDTTNKSHVVRQSV